MNLTLSLFSAVSFLGYGLGCFFLAHLKKEFDRYGFGPQRVLVGALQVSAAIGLVAGYYLPWVGVLSSGGLALMMLIAVGVRIKIKDTLIQTIPALFYLALNTYLCLAAF